MPIEQPGYVPSSRASTEGPAASPISQARQLLGEVRKRADRILVGFSGGKDSLAALDLAVDVFGAKNVVPFAMYLVKGLRIFEGPIDAAARRYGLRVEYVPHWMLGRMFKHAVLMPHPPGDAHKWREMKLGDIESLVRKRTGIDWIAYGHRASESPQRRGMISSCQAMSVKQRRVYPIGFWHVADVRAFLRFRRIPIPPQVGRQNGVDLEPKTLAFIKAHYPDDYAKILKVFPFAGVQLVRRELYADDEAG